MAHTSTYQITSTAQEKNYIAKSSSATGTNLLLDLVKLERLPNCNNNTSGNILHSLMHYYIPRCLIFENSLFDPTGL